MIRDITIGQYFPGKSAIHKMDPRIKILLSILYIVMLFVADNMWGLLLGVLFGFAAYLISRIPLSMIWKSMKPVVPIVIFTAVLNLFLSTGDPLWQWKFLKITKEGIETAVFMSVRILCLIAGTSLLTYTTSPIALTDGIERLLSPLKKIKLPVHELAMMMTIALRFIPTLIEETDKIMSAQKARGADLESGGVMQRAKALLPILDETMANFDNFEVVSADILKTDIPALVREKLAGLTPIVCANLPYNITTPAITALLESKCFESITVLVQKEVAERLCAAPGTAAYGAFSVYMQYHTAPRLLFEVGRECFQPQPKVTSAVLRAEVRKTPPVAVEDEKFFFRVVYAAFALRRKTIVNSLMTGFGSQLTKEQVTEAVVSAGLAPTVRGEKLGLEEFARLTRALYERLPA